MPHKWKILSAPRPLFIVNAFTSLVRKEQTTLPETVPGTITHQIPEGAASVAAEDSGTAMGISSSAFSAGLDSDAPAGSGAAALATNTTAASAAVTAGGWGRRPLSLQNRGVSFFGGGSRRDPRAGGAGGGAAWPGSGTIGTGGAVTSGGKRAKAGLAAMAEDREAVGLEGSTGSRKDEALVFAVVKRQSVPRGEPLCCKRLTQVPLSQVSVVRAGIVTLCAEGLLRLWARPIVPAPLGEDRLQREGEDDSTAGSSRNKVSEMGGGGQC